MGSLRNILAGLCLSLAAQSHPALAQTLPVHDTLRLFATCTGRLSALMEYQWLVQDPGAEATELRRDQMAQLLEAVLPKGAEARAMQLRLEAKLAAAQLLQQGLQRSGGWAVELARRQVADCTALLVS